MLIKNLKSKIITILFFSLFCGKALALPQDWPCDELFVSVVNENIENYSYDFKGINGDYELTLNGLGILSPGNCGTIGCYGTIKNLKTGVSENMYFDCASLDDPKKMGCFVIINEEYWLRKFTDDEYRLTYPLCDVFYDYIKLSECKGCACTMKTTRKGYEDYQEELRCLLEKNILHCYNWQRYDETHENGNYLNCDGLGGF